MMLAILIVAVAGVAVIAGMLARRESSPAWLLVALVIAAPIAAFLTMLRTAPERGSSARFEVLGQYHPLNAPITLSTVDAADFVIDPVVSGGDTHVTLAYDGSSGMLRVEVTDGAMPVILSGTVINGMSLGRRNVLGRGDFRTILTKPWWCLYRCSARRIDVWVSGAHVERREASIDTVLRLPFANDSVTVFRHGRRDYTVGNPRHRFTVNGVDVPVAASAPPGLLEIGTPARVSLDVRVDVDAQRLDLLFARGARGGWDFARSDSTRTVIVSATAGADLPGMLPVINPAAIAPGAARAPYGGVLERNDAGRWVWHSRGQSRELRGASAELLPGYNAGEAGHVIMLGQSRQDTRAVISALVAVWLLGGVLIAWMWRHVGTDVLPLRIVLLGLFNTLLFVRGILAVRVWLLPPLSERAPITFIATLLAMPALIACYHAWQHVARRRYSVQVLLRALIPVVAFIIIAAVVLIWQLPSHWLGTVALAAILPLGIGTIGLAALERLLLGPGDAATMAPFSAFDVDTAENPGYRRFLSTATTLVLLGASLFVVTRLEHTGRLTALAICALLGALVLFVASDGSAIVRPHRPLYRLVLAVVLAGIGGSVAYSFTGSWMVAPLGAAAGAWLGWKRGGPQPLVRPFRIHELVPAWFFIAVFGVVMLTISLGLTSRLRVTMEYALAIAGLIVVARIFALAWAARAPRESTEPMVVRRSAHRHFGVRDLVSIVVVLGVAAIIYVPLGLTDPGFVLLYFSSAALAALVALQTLHRNGRLAAAVLLVALLGGAIWTMAVREQTLVDASSELSTPQVRFAGTYHAEALERYMLRAPEANPFEIVRTLQQYWGTDQYAAMAGTTGRGFFNAEFSTSVVPRPVALTENVFAVFLLSEHGWIGGVAVLLLYLLITLALLAAAARCTLRPEHRARAVFLTGLAAFCAIPALYMAAANGRIVPLTGQNMPMLGLLSIADAALGSWLAALAVSVLPAAISRSVVYRPPDDRSVRLRQGVAAFGVLITVTTVVVAALLWRPTHNDGGPFRLAVLTAEAETFVNRDLLVVDADTIGIVPSALQHPALTRGTLLRRGIRASNRIARGERSAGNCYELDPMFRIRDGEIAVPGSLCSVRVPGSQRNAWLGPLRTDDGSARAVLTDGRSAVLLTPNAELNIARFGRGCTTAGTTHARSVRVGCNDEGAVLSAGHMMVTVESTDTTQIEINGARPGPLSVLRPGDRLRAHAADIVMTALPPGALGYARWENGNWRRLNTPSAGTWIAQIDSQLNVSLSSPTHAMSEAVVALDDNLHAALRERLAAACAVVPGARLCSVVLADPANGEIVAFADSRGDITPPAHLPADANLRNHPSASAIKPILALAALKAYPALAGLEVDHSAALIETVANVPIAPAMRAARLYPQPRVPWQGFLPASDNLYAATLGFLAVAQPRNGMPRMSGSANDSRITIGGRSVAGVPAWPRAGTRLKLHESPLANALQEIYGVYPAAAGSPPIERSFWQTAIDAGVMHSSNDLQRITPEPVVLKLDSVTAPRQLATFMIGGGENRWNNVALAQAIARIHSGNATQLHILRSVGDVAIAPPSPAIQSLGPQLAAVRAGMRGVITRTWGTAHTLDGLFPIEWIAKTGTLQEREWTGSVFLFAGGSNTACGMVGAITVQLESRANPDGVATRLFRDQVAPLLKQHAGWGGTPCSRR